MGGGVPGARPRYRRRPIAGHRSPAPAGGGRPDGPGARAGPRRRAAATRLGSGTSAASRGAVATASASPQRGEDPDQRADVAGQDGLGFRERQALQVSTQGIDHAIERLVGHRLLLVAPTRQKTTSPPPARSSRKRRTSAVFPIPEGPWMYKATVRRGTCPRRRPPGDSSWRARPTSGAARCGDRRQGHGDLGSPVTLPRRRSTSCPVGRASGSRRRRSTHSALRSVGRPGHQLARGGRLESLLVPQASRRGGRGTERGR